MVAGDEEIGLVVDAKVVDGVDYACDVEAVRFRGVEVLR
jgi:hypothetical protein